MKSILVIDNDRVFLQLMTKFLEKEGHQVKTAIDGLNALDVLKTCTPDIIFIDLVMPNIDGETLCRILRGMDKFNNTYLVIVSAISTEECIDVAQLGANACIAKGPFEEMSQHVLATLDEPKSASLECFSGKVFGADCVYPRGITEELLSIRRHCEVILEKMTDGIFEINAADRIVYANQAARALVHIPLKGLLGLNFADLFGGEDHRRVVDLLRLSGPREIDDNAPAALDDSLVTLKVLPLDNAETSAIIITHDVTERKKAQHALETSRAYAQNIIDSSLDMIISVDNNRRIVEFNRAAERAFGYRKAEIVGKSVEILYADVEQGRELREKALKSENHTGEITNIAKDGHTFDTLLSMAFMRDPEGNVIGSVGVSRDITEQKKIKKELEKHRDNLEEIVNERTLKLSDSEKRYRTLFERAGDAIFLLEAEGPEPGRIVDANQAAADMHGYTIDELLQLNIRDIDTPDEAKKVSGRIRRMLQSGWINREMYHLRKDGTLIAVEVSAGLLELGGKKYILAVDRDITRRKRALADRVKLMAQLQRSEKMEAIGTLAGGVAHDLNNILSGIVSYPELLLLDLPEESPLHQPILTIQQSGEKAAAIVQDLLTLARRGVVANTVVNLKEIVEDYLDSAEFEKLASQYPGVQIALDIETAPFHILGSPIHLLKTVMNLVSNAFEAVTSRGTVTLSLKNKYIDRPLEGYDTIARGEYVVLTVADNGIGISPEHLGKIFEPFYSKKKMGRSGTGLGTAVIWGTVKDHNGFIDLKSVLGAYTTFTLYFPVTRQDITPDTPSATLDSYLGNKETILVVDDAAEQREIASNMLTRLGYDVSTCSSGEEALVYLAGNPVDLLLLDMIMAPGINGLETYRQTIDMHPGQKAIIASGFSETDNVKAAQALGAGTYIKKPYTLENIGIAVRDELKK